MPLESDYKLAKYVKSSVDSVITPLVLTDRHEKNLATKRRQNMWSLPFRLCDRETFCGMVSNDLPWPDTKLIIVPVIMPPSKLHLKT